MDKHLRVIVALLVLPLSAFAASYTASVSGNWNNAATWGGAGIPVAGDTVTINNAVTVTVPTGYAAVVGTTPADQTTYVIQCQATNGTGGLVVQSGASLEYRGNVYQCANTWTINGSLIHNSNGSGVHYRWNTSTSAANSVLAITGPGASWTSADTVYAGQFGNNLASYNDGGQLRCTDATISYIGGGTEYLQKTLLAAGASFYQGCAVTHSGLINVTANSGASVWYFDDSTYTLPGSTLALGSGGSAFKLSSLTALTTGTRRMSNSWIEGSIVSTMQKLEYRHLFTEACRSGCDSSTGVFGGNGTLSAENTLEDVFAWYRLPNGAVGSGDQLPSGSLTDLYTLMSSASANMHAWATQQQGAVTFSRATFDTMNADSAGDYLQVGLTSAGGSTAITNLLCLPGSAGLAGGACVNISTAAANDDNVSITVDHATIAAGRPSAIGTEGIGIMMEGTKDKPSALYAAVKNVLAWRLDSGYVYVVGTANATYPNGAITGANYNAWWNSNGLASVYANGGNASLFASPNPPGTNDVGEVNPGFVDRTRNAALFPSAYLHLENTACSGVCADWSAAAQYSAGDIVYHGKAGYFGGASILWRATQAHAGSTAGSEPGNLTTCAAWQCQSFTNYWEPYVVQLMREKMPDATATITDSSIACSGCTYNQALNSWVRGGYAPTNAALNAADDGGTIGAVPLKVQSGTVSASVAASADDACERVSYATANVIATSCFVSADDGGGLYNWVGYRFAGITIPAGATITAAYVQVWPTDADDPGVRIYFEDGGAPAQFGTGDNDISARTRTTAYVDWSAADVGMERLVNTPSLVSIIQELIASYSYSGGTMAMLMQGTAAGTGFQVRQYDGAVTYAAVLHIEYTEGASATVRKRVVVSQ